MNHKAIHIKGIGEISIYKNHRTRRLNLSLNPVDGIKITIPKYISYLNVERMLEDKRKWLEESISKLRASEKRNYTVFDENTDFSTKYHKLKVLKTTKSKPEYEIIEKYIKFYCPKNLDIRSKEIQKEIRESIEETLRIEAKLYLPKRTMEFASKFNLKILKVSIKNSKTRWGSCSYNNNINLSLHLMRVPDELIDYVILHELTHTVHKNHNKNFWNYLYQICPDADRLDKEMKKYNPLYY